MLIYTTDIKAEIDKIAAQYPENKRFILTDKNTTKLCLPIISECKSYSTLQHIEIDAGEDNKSIESVVKVWEFLSKSGADRNSLLINLGGGMITDLGSFVGLTFKRGLDIYSIPTTLLSQVDASVGGKTGFNFNHLKNEIGVISQPNGVIMDTIFLKTVSDKELKSGLAEMIKHGLIFSEQHLEESLNIDLANFNRSETLAILQRSVDIKNSFVTQDPNEKGIRKALNFGHTIGHAFESVALDMGAEIPHGYAVAYGMICELYLSHKVCGLEIDVVNNIVSKITAIYGKYSVNDIDRLIELMQHDKKNVAGSINFSLLEKIGEIKINCNCSNRLIEESIIYLNEI